MAIRVRRAADKSDLFDTIIEGDRNAFEYLYEALIFCAALGYASNRRVPLGATGESIRWELFQEGADALSAMLAVAASDDPEILAPERSDERILIFEEYANGGLEALAEELDRHPTKTPREVVLQLVLDQQEVEETDLGIRKIAEDLSG